MLSLSRDRCHHTCGNKLPMKAMTILDGAKGQRVKDQCKWHLSLRPEALNSMPRSSRQPGNKARNCPERRTLQLAGLPLQDVTICDHSLEEYSGKKTSKLSLSRMKASRSKVDRFSVSHCCIIGATVTM